MDGLVVIEILVLGLMLAIFCAADQYFYFQQVMEQPDLYT